MNTKTYTCIHTHTNMQINMHTLISLKHVTSCTTTLNFRRRARTCALEYALNKLCIAGVHLTTVAAKGGRRGEGHWGVRRG